MVALPLVGIACSGRGLWPPYAEDVGDGGAPFGRVGGVWRTMGMQQQIPFGNDKQRGIADRGETGVAGERCGGCFRARVRVRAEGGMWA